MIEIPLIEETKNQATSREYKEKDDEKNEWQDENHGQGCEDPEKPRSSHRLYHPGLISLLVLESNSDFVSQNQEAMSFQA